MQLKKFVMYILSSRDVFEGRLSAQEKTFVTRCVIPSLLDLVEMWSGTQPCTATATPTPPPLRAYLRTFICRGALHPHLFTVIGGRASAMHGLRRTHLLSEN